MIRPPGMVLPGDSSARTVPEALTLTRTVRADRVIRLPVGTDPGDLDRGGVKRFLGQ